MRHVINGEERIMPSDWTNREGERLDGVNMKNIDYVFTDFQDASFVDVNLIGAKLQHVHFADVKIDTIQMGGAVFENIIRPTEESNFSVKPGEDGWVNAEPVKFISSDLSTAKFENCILRNVEIHNCDLTGLRINGQLLKDLLEDNGKLL